MTQESPPKWLDVLDRLNPPQETILTDPADTKKVLENLNMSGCRFQHVDGEVRMGLYVPCADPETKEGVGLAVIFLDDDTRLYRRAASIQGVDLEKAAIEVLGDYMETFHNPGVAVDAPPKHELPKVVYHGTEKVDFSLAATDSDVRSTKTDSHFFAFTSSIGPSEDAEPAPKPAPRMGK